MGGWFKFYRKMVYWKWYKHHGTFRVFVHILIYADYQSGVINKGILTIQNIAEDTNLTRRQVERALANLQKTGEIKINKSNKKMIIEIANYETYQANNVDLGKHNEKNEKIISACKSNTYENQEGWKKGGSPEEEILISGGKIKLPKEVECQTDMHCSCTDEKTEPKQDSIMRGGKKVQPFTYIKEKEYIYEIFGPIEKYFSKNLKSNIQFYMDQIKCSEGEGYLKFIKFLFWDNDTERRLKMVEWKHGQISFKQFLKLREISIGDQLMKVCLRMQASNKDYGDFFLTLKGWIINDKNIER